LPVSAIVARERRFEARKLAGLSPLLKLLGSQSHALAVLQFLESSAHVLGIIRVRGDQRRLG
jgi:hypothetical protein